MNKQILVTVGTTKFEDLIGQLDNESFYKNLDVNGFTSLIFQIGNGEYIPCKYELLKLNGLKVKIVKFLPMFEDVIKESEYIISHCGAGSLLEGLKNKKNVIAVINDKLMDNHQSELAFQLYKENYILLIKKLDNIVIELESLLKTKTKLNSYPDFNYDIIPQVINDMLDI